ncbi:MAG: tetratricopeptide repeat protein [Verrucomicrobiota bacterium]
MIRTETRIRYANGYLDLGMLREASAELKAIDDEGQETPACIAMWNRHHLSAKRWKALSASAEQLTKIDPQEPYGWVNWAYALRELERISEAKEVAQRALALHPKEAVLWFNLACYCCLLDKIDQAREHLKTAIDLEESFREEAKTDPDLNRLRETD